MQPPTTQPTFVNNWNTRKRCEICSKLTIKTPERRQWRRSDVFIVNFEYISLSSTVSIINFEQVNVSWETSPCLKSTIETLEKAMAYAQS